MPVGVVRDPCRDPVLGAIFHRWLPVSRPDVPTDVAIAELGDAGA
jgi:hypothetical protein